MMSWVVPAIVLLTLMALFWSVLGWCYQWELPATAETRVDGSFLRYRATVVFGSQLKVNFFPFVFADSCALALWSLARAWELEGYSSEKLRFAAVHVLSDVDFDNAYGKDRDSLLEFVPRRGWWLKDCAPLIICRVSAINQEPYDGVVVIHEMTHYLASFTYHNALDPYDNAHQLVQLWRVEKNAVLKHRLRRSEVTEV